MFFFLRLMLNPAVAVCCIRSDLGESNLLFTLYVTSSGEQRRRRGLTEWKPSVRIRSRGLLCALYYSCSSRFFFNLRLFTLFCRKNLDFCRGVFRDGLLMYASELGIEAIEPS